MTAAGRRFRLVDGFLLLPGLAWLCLRAWRTLDPAEWSPVADGLGHLTGCLPGSLAVLRLHGRALRAARRSDEAVAAARKALAARPDDPGLLFELGRCLRQAGKRTEAIATLSRAAALGSQAAERELCRYAARHALPHRAGGIFAREDYGAFVAAWPPPSPPRTAPCALFRVSLAGNEAERAGTMESLRRQSHTAWHLAGQAPEPQWSGLAAWDLPLPAGAELAGECLAWLDHAIAATGCGEVRADHDHRDKAGSRCNPVFLPPEPDILWTEAAGSPVRLGARRPGAAGPVCHVPLILMTLPLPTGEPGQPLVLGEPRTLSVIIPSRDNPEMLAAAIASLRQTAAQPGRIELVIVDNGSRTSPARELLDQLGRQEGVMIVSFDEPFNWSRASNLGAAVATGERLLFLNDDTVMQTRHWDRILSGLFERPEVGLIGARMVYPDGTIQHGGFVFGMDNGPQHEGRWMAGDDAGPGGRWTAIRQAAAVTGAFMAIRAGDFADLGGFDEQAFAIDFADLDLCLKVRSAGRAVAYCGAISLMHHESVSRGLNIARSKRRRMSAEKHRFEARWGKAASDDPWYHPVWSRKGASYDGMCATGIASESQKF